MSFPNYLKKKKIPYGLNVFICLIRNNCKSNLFESSRKHFSMDKPQPYNWPTESETPGVRLACVLQKSFHPV